MEKSGLNAKTPQEYRSRSEPRSSTESRESRNSKNRTRSCNPSRKSGQSTDANSYGGSNSSSSQSKSMYPPNQISSSCTDSCSDHKVLSSSHHIQLPVNEPSNTNIEVPLRKNVIRISRKSFGNKCVLEEIEDVSTKQDKQDIADVKKKRSSSAKTKSSKTSIKNSSDSLSSNKKPETQRRNGVSTSSNSNSLCHCTHPSISSKLGSHTKSSNSNNHVRSSSQNSHRTSRSRSVSIGRTKQVSFSPSCETSEPNSRQSSRDFANDRGLEKGLLSGASSSSNTMTSKLSQFLNYVKVFRSSSPAAPQHRVGYEYLMTYVDDSVYEHIFSYLTHEELQQCSYVCKLWMKIVMPKLGGIVVFNGKTFLWSSESRSKKCIEKFLGRIRYNEQKFRHPCKIKFVNVKNDQMKYLIYKEYSDCLRMSVRNMTHINFNSCRIKWSTLVDLLLHFENLKVLTDENSHHYSFQNRLFRLPETQTHISKTVGRNIFHENGLTKVKNVRITRKTFDQEFINYILLLRATIHNLHEFSLVVIGPCEKSWKNPLFVAANERDMTEFTINLRLFLISQGRHLKKIFFKWSSEMYTDLFAKCMETLKLPNHFYSLSELTLTFERKSMKMPKNLDILMNFLKIHCAKALRMFRCSVIVLGTHWNEMVDQMEILINQKSFTTHFELGVELCDGFGQSVTKVNKNNLGLSLFVEYVTHVNIYVENEKTCSIKEMMPQESTKQYLRVKKFNVKFAPGGKYPNFKDFKMDSIAHNFPNLHELFIQDEIERSEEQSSGASLGDPEIQLISAVLVKLRVLRIWTNLESLTDYGITGICPEEIYSLQTKRTRSTNGVEHDLRSSFSSLSDIRELSLRGVGKGVTSISARFGFENLPKLQYLEIIGAHKISRSGKKVLQKKLRSNNPECILKLDSEEDLALKLTYGLQTNKTMKTFFAQHIYDLTDTCFENIFSYLRGKDLKNCRFVCRLWRDFVDELIGEKTKVVFDGIGFQSYFMELPKLFFSSKCNHYLKKSDTQFDLWSNLKMTNIYTNQIRKIVDLKLSNQFQSAVYHITVLELKSCTLTWCCVTNILKSFISLESLLLIKNTYYYRSLTFEDFWCIVNREDMIDLKYRKFWPSFSKDDGKYCRHLKNVYIDETPNEFVSTDVIIPRRGTVKVMSMLRKLRIRCEKLEFKLQLQNALTTTSEQNLTWLKMTKFISTCPLRVLRLTATETSDRLSFDRFIILTAGLFALFPAVFIEELYLSFPYLNVETLIGQEFLEFTDFLNAMQKLKVFYIGTFVFKASSADLIESLEPKQNNCKFRVGIFISDKDGISSTKEAVEILNSSYFKKRIASIDMLIYDQTDLSELKPLLPVSYDWDQKYDFREPFMQVKSFQLKFTSEVVRPNFKSFNIDILTMLFPNLTILDLSCGPCTQTGYYHLMDSKTVQNSIISDYDLRLIIQHLLRLTKLSLWANLKQITDFGITGKMNKISDTCTVGYSFSHLKDLWYISLRGVGKFVTDLSAFNGFNDMPKLKYLEIIGKHKISSAGRKYLKNKTFFRSSLSFMHTSKNPDSVDDL